MATGPSLAPPPSRRGRRSYQTQQVRTYQVGAAAWPRSRMQGPTPSRRGRRSYQTQRVRTTR